MGRKLGWTMYAALVAMAISAAGACRPGVANDAVADGAEPQQAEPRAAVGKSAGAEAAPSARLRTLEFIPADAKLVVVLSPVRIAHATSIDGTPSPILGMDMEKMFGVKLNEIEDIKIVMTGEVANRVVVDRIVLRSSKPTDWGNWLKYLFPGTTDAHQLPSGREYYVGKMPKVPFLGNSFYKPDDRTIVIATEKEMRELLADEKTLRNEALESAQVGVHVHTEFVRTWTDSENPQRRLANPLLASVLPLIDDTEAATFTSQVLPKSGGTSEQLSLILTLNCKTNDSTQRVADTLSAVRSLGLNFVHSTDRDMAEIARSARPASVPPQQTAIVPTMLELASKLLKNTKIQSSQSEGVARATAQIDFPKEALAAIFHRRAADVNEAALQSQSTNNMKQLMLALHNYHAAHKRFPPAIVVGKDGKPLHSWRVAILPFLEETGKLEDYRLDEPWDSEHNRQFIDRMPAVFRDPHDAPGSTNSAYYMITGKGTVGESATGTKLREMTDGASKTIMLVQAKRDVPWTKPEDIEIDADPEKSLPKFGGFMQPEGTFVAAFADGSVRVIVPNADEKTLRAFFTIAGGEVVDMKLLTSPKPEGNKQGAAS